MNILKNIYKENLNLLINRKSNEIIKYDNCNYNNLLNIDNSYYSYYFSSPSFKNISTILQHSFNKHFILISIMNNMKLLNSQNYNELNYNEYKANIIKFIETSIDGLNRLILDNKNNKEVCYLMKVKDECEKQLELIKTNNINITLKKINNNDNSSCDSNSSSCYSTCLINSKKVRFKNSDYDSVYDHDEEYSKPKQSSNNFIYNIFKNILDMILLFTRFMF